ncbi:MAG: electron transfer flavoprotein subunit beta [Caldisericales bacterium]|nr:electron transfer flavoprotein subunit beta [Caldisericales bacterium]
MKIAVCVKQVPDPEKFSVGSFGKDWRLSRDSYPKTANPVDKNALELALQLSGQDPVEVITMGPENAKEALREMLAIGASSAVHVVDRALEGADLLTTAVVLSATIKKRGPFDMIICGKQSTDAGNASIPSMVAEILGSPSLTGCEKVEFVDGKIFASQPGDLGMVVWKIELPCVLSVTKNINTPRLPSLRGMTRAMQTEIATYGLQDIGIGNLPEGRLQPANMLDSKQIAREVATAIMEGETPQVKAAALLMSLREKGLIQ